MKGVYVMGLSRSGTSLVAGLLRSQGVFFGHTFPPTDNNPKGNLEHQWLKEDNDHGYVVVEEWLEELRLEAIDMDWHPIDGSTPPWQGGEIPVWGLKGGGRLWMRFGRRADPDAVVLCYRPLSSVQASRRRAGMQEIDLLRAYQRMASMTYHWGADQPQDRAVFVVGTPALIKGDFTAVQKVTDHLGLSWHDDWAREWVDPALWTA